MWVQLCCPIERAGQSVNLLSVPVQATSSNQICPFPLMKPELRAVAPNMMSQGQMIETHKSKQFACRMK